MENFLLFIDRLSAGVGKAFGWCIVIMTLGTCYEVFMRYLLRAPTDWAFDVSYLHVRRAVHDGRRLYAVAQRPCARRLRLPDVAVRACRPPSTSSCIFLFFFPGFGALFVYGIPYAEQSWHIHEVSIYSPTGAPVYPHKTLIPIAAALMLLQGLAEIIRCIICLRDGVWPQRLHDVEEMESAILAEAAGPPAHRGRDARGGHPMTFTNPEHRDDPARRCSSSSSCSAFRSPSR